MRRKSAALFVAALAAVVLSAGAGFAQQPAPGVLAAPRPTFSPYLNLARRDVNPGLTYAGIVRPQIATANALRSLQQQITPSAQPAAMNQTTVDPGLPVTGQPTYFLNSGGYFLNSRTGPPAGYTPARTTRQLPSPYNPAGARPPLQVR